MKSIKVKRLAKMFPKYVGRWVPVQEALPPEGIGVLVARNDLDGPMFAYLKYAAGDKWSPWFVCAGYAGLKDRGMVPSDGLVATTHWFSPTLEGLPVVTRGLHAELGLGSAPGQDYAWYDTSEYTRKHEDEVTREEYKPAS